MAPGCYDALSALMIERAGFPAAYLSGASIAYTRHARPDVGLVSMTEVADIVGAIADRITVPLVVDADTGFGNALNVMRTVKLFANRGAAAIQLEDQTTPKRCGHLADKSVVAAGEMIGKIKAALDARPSEEVLIIARTDAIAVEGFAKALDRAEAYREAGADLLFVEAPRSDDELAYLSLDGQPGLDLQDGDRVRCRRSEHKVNLFRTSSDFFQVLRSKLKWGER